MKRLLLIDAHALVHRMFHALAPLTGPQGEPVGALYGLAKLLLKIKTEMNPEYIVACFDRPEPTFRKERYPDYKITRQPTAPELIPQLIESRKVFDWFKIKQFEMAGFEADDLLGTLARRAAKEPDLKVMVLSGDRDLLQLVDDDKIFVLLMKNGGETETREYNADKVKEEYGIEAKQFIDYKAIVGDASDNIPGVRGIGPKSAVPLLQEFETLEGIYDNLVIINPKIAKKFEEQRENAFLSKELATIKCDCSVFLDSIEDLRAAPLNKEELKKHFESLGFVSLANKL